MEQLDNHIDKKDNIITFEGISFYMIEHLDSLNVEDTINYNAVLINGKDESFIRQIVRRIRNNKNPEIYLKPVFLLKGLISLTL